MVLHYVLTFVILPGKLLENIIWTTKRRIKLPDSQTKMSRKKRLHDEELICLNIQLAEAITATKWYTDIFLEGRASECRSKRIFKEITME